MVLIELVHTRHQPSPGRLGPLFTRLLLQMVVKLTETHQLTYEVALLAAEGILQQITGPRLLQMEQPHHEVRHVHRLGAAVEHLLTGRLYHLSHQVRGLGIVVAVVGHRLHILEFLLHPFGEHLRRVEHRQRPAEVIIVDQRQQQVFRHDELMSVLPAALHRISQDLSGPIRLFNLSHSLYASSGSTVSLSGYPASRAMAVALRTFEVATS